MGLLNDAIRDHLDLKRLHGADPSEVARLEHEALGPDVREPGFEEGTVADSYSDSAPDGATPPENSGGHPGDIEMTGQETAELDMRTVLRDDPGSVATADPREVLEEAYDPTKDPQVDLIDRVPAVTHEEADDKVDAAEGPGDVEDVLEETPDFLQETPEHERLWFEQRPPRDFDFDK